jgi:transcriptional regulator with XRE-family HTH domain
MLQSTHTVRIQVIGAELRRYRDAAGLTLRQVQEQIGIDKTQLNRMETGDRAQRCDEVAGLLAIYGVKGKERRELLELSQQAHEPGLWDRHSERASTLQFLESRAVRMINFACQLIPGLLQTFPYAQAVIRHVGMINDQKLIDERVAARIRRQGPLRRPGGPELLAIIMESALRNVIGDEAIMRQQLDYLAEAAQRPNIKLRVIPASVGNHPGHEGPFVRMQFRTRRGVIVLANRTSSLYLEDDEDLLFYNQVLVELLSVALGEEDSVAFVRELAQKQF